MRLRTAGLGLRFDGLEVIRQLDLEAGEGEVVVLLGPSGCGKSSLLAMLGGLLEPTTGEVEWSGDVPEGSLSPVTFVFQEASLLPWRTVRGNVALPLEDRLSPPECRRRVEDSLRLMELGDFGDAFPSQLSGGMQQRVGLARALAVDPSVLLMDEPLSALDAMTREVLLEELVELWRTRPTTTVYVTHNLWEALTVADRIVVLSERPATVRAVFAVPLARQQRLHEHAALAAMHDRIWELLRQERQLGEGR